MPSKNNIFPQVDNTSVAIVQPQSIELADEYSGGMLQPAYVSAELPRKFNGSQEAARRYAEGYQFGRGIASSRDSVAPYVASALTLPLDVTGTVELATAIPAISRGVKNLPLVFRNFQNWKNWSRAGKISPKHMLEYRMIEAKNGLRGVDIADKAKVIGVDPRAYVQSQSKAFKKFLGNADFKVQYHGTPIKDAEVFPKPSDADYAGKLPGTGTYEEGIYVTSNPEYAKRYSRSGIKMHNGEVTGDVHQVAIGGNPTSIDELSGKGVLDDWNASFFNHISSDQRKAINDLGYDILIDSPAGRFDILQDETVVFEPNQIKSLQGNNGDFNMLSRNIYRRNGGKIDKISKLVDRINYTSTVDFVRRFLDEKRKALSTDSVTELSQ